MQSASISNLSEMCASRSNNMVLWLGFGGGRGGTFFTGFHRDRSADCMSTKETGSSARFLATTFPKLLLRQSLRTWIQCLTKSRKKSKEFNFLLDTLSWNQLPRSNRVPLERHLSTRQWNQLKPYENPQPHYHGRTWLASKRSHVIKTIISFDYIYVYKRNIFCHNTLDVGRELIGRKLSCFWLESGQVFS